MLVGTLAAIIHGVALPLMMLIFGDMTDSFASVGNVSKNSTNMSKYCLWYKLYWKCAKKSLI
jgi:ATP-binding cassette subfamily B (MDR/TAP) protein 1